MHKRTFVLFVVGLVLETAGFFGGHAEDIPLVTKILVPSEASISEGVRHLETNPDLSPGQPGFDAISKLLLRLLKEQTSQPLIFLPSVRKIYVESSGTLSFGGQLLAQNSQLKVQLSNGQEVAWDLAGIRDEVKRLKETRVFWAAVGIFVVGIIVQCVGFYLENKEEK